MKKKNILTLDDEFTKYCELNGIIDIEKLAKETFNRGFSLLKYGETPTNNVKTKEVIKEVPVEVEVIREVIVEKIVEVIKEVPIEIKGDTKIITKEIEKVIINTDEIDKLKIENGNLKNEIEKINQSLDKFNRAKYMKNSDMGSLYDE